MTKLLQFFSVALLTQVTLALSQLILLPIQIRIWGHGAIAVWYSALAVAMLTTIFDCGLRTAGHSELLRYASNRSDVEAGERVQQVWGWIRVLIFVLTAALIIGEASIAAFRGSPYEIWKALLIVAYSLETLLTVRIVYLDSLGFYRGAEASYFVFVAMRLVLAVPALLLLRVQATGLAWLFLAASAVGLALQERLCRKVGVLGVFSPLPRKFSIRVLGVARYTLAEPCANWVRLSLPVLVVAAVAPPSAVTAYVALRAVFGAARVTVQQLSRFASVEYLRLHAEAADSLLSTFVLVAGFFGAALASFVVVDNIRILGIWLAHLDRSMFQTIAISFALSAPFYAYQVLLTLMFRMGKLAAVAHRQYAYVVYSGLFAVIASKTGSLVLYLVLLVASEVLLSVAFMLPSIGGRKALRTLAGSRGLVSAFAGSMVVLLLWCAARWNLGDIFSSYSPAAVVWTAIVLLFGLGGVVVFNYLTNIDLFKTAPSLFRQSSKAKSMDEAYGKPICY